MNRSRATRLVSIAANAALLVLAAGCAGEPGGSDPAGASAAELNTPAAPAVVTPFITPASFVAHFGKPWSVPGQNQVPCALGEVRMFAGGLPPNFWPADGRLVYINQNAALFTQMGTSYGGDGRSTFALPNLTVETPNGVQYAVCMGSVGGWFVGP